MIEYPEEIKDTVRRFFDDGKLSPREAAVAALKVIKRLPAYDEWAESLIIAGLMGIGNDYRHQLTRQMKRETGMYGAKAKVNPYSPSIENAARSMYQTFFLGTMLGMIRGEQLDGLIESERRKEKGHKINVDFLLELKALVPSGKMVQQCVSENKLRTLALKVGLKNFPGHEAA